MNNIYLPSNKVKNTSRTYALIYYSHSILKRIIYSKYHIMIMENISNGDLYKYFLKILKMLNLKKLN